MIDLFEAVVRLSISAVPVILAVMAGRLILSFAPKKYSYALWSVVAFRLCVPVSFTSRFGLQALFNSIYALFNKSSDSQGITNYLPNHTGHVTELTGTEAVFDSVAVTEKLPSAGSATSSVSFSEVLPALLTAVWLFGIAVILILGALSYLKLKNSVSDARSLDGRVYRHKAALSPFVIGFLRPRIILPEGLDDECVSSVTAHESCHIRRGDHIIKAAGFLILTFHWFNPLCYLAFFLMSRDMEMSCDESVLASMTSPDKRKEYSMTILKTATNNKAIRQTVSFGAVGVKRRIKRTLRYKKPSVLVTAVSLLICAVMLFGCAANAPADDSENSESTSVTEAPKYEPTPLDDAITRANIAFFNEDEDHASGNNEDKYTCARHAVAKTYENEAEGYVSVIIRLPTWRSFNIITGEQNSCRCGYKTILIKFKKEGDVYEKLIYDVISSSGDITPELLEECFPEEDIDAMKQFIIDVDHGMYTSEESYTPYRYEKDGVLYELDEGQRYKYFESLIAEILTSSESYDDPEGYITENRETFEKLYSERDIEKFLMSEFLKGGNDDLRGFVMYRALEEFLANEGVWHSRSEPFEYMPADNNGQEYFDAWLEAVLKLVSEEGYFNLSKTYRYTWIDLYETYTEDMTDEEFADLGYVFDLPDEIIISGNGKSIVFDDGDDEYYKVFRESTYMFFDPDKTDSKSVKDYGEVDGVDDFDIKHMLGFDSHFNGMMIWAEFNYDDAPTVIIGGAIMIYEYGDVSETLDDGKRFVLIENDNGKYDFYAPRSSYGDLNVFLTCLY